MLLDHLQSNLAVQHFVRSSYTMLNSPAILGFFSIRSILLATSYQPFPYFMTSLFSSARVLKLPFIPQRETKTDVLPYVFPLYTEFDSIHDFFMNLALQKAKEAASKNEVPVGAVLVSCDQNKTHYSYNVISAAHNMVENLFDASAHAELLALRSGAQSIRNWRLYNTTLYCTLEPCPLCLSACQAFRVKSIVYGAKDIRLGAVESYMRLLDKNVNPIHPFHPNIFVISGVRADECSDLMRDFFRKRRVPNPV